MRYKAALAAALLIFLHCPLTARSQRAPELARSLSLSLGAQGRLMWVDGTANLTRTVTVNGVMRTVDYTTTRQGVQEIVRHCKAANINTLVIDVKPLSGQTLYNSRVAPHMAQWKGRAVPDFDVLAAFIEEGHKAGIQVAACMNTLSEGHKLAKAGPIYQHPEWQSVVYTVDRGLVLSNGGRLSLHVAGEPSDPAGAVLQDEDHAVSGDPSGLTGLEGPDTVVGVNASSTVGQQTNLILDENNRVAGVVDSALLGDDPLVAPEGGRIVTMTRDSGPPVAVAQREARRVRAFRYADAADADRAGSQRKGLLFCLPAAARRAPPCPRCGPRARH